MHTGLFQRTYDNGENSPDKTEAKIDTAEVSRSTKAFSTESTHVAAVAVGAVAKLLRFSVRYETPGDSV